MDEINFLEMTKKECISAGESAALNEIEEAKTNILDAYLYTKAKIEYLTAFSKTLHEEAMNEFNEYGEKEVSKYGRKLSVMETGTKYDFSKCGHPDILKFEESMKSDKEHLDATKKLVKNLQRPTTIVDDETGETYQVKPPIKSSTTILKVTY